MAKDKDLDLDDMDEFDDMGEFDEGDRSPSTTGYSKKQIVQDSAEFTKKLAMKTGKKVLPDEYGAGIDAMVEYKDYLSEIATTSKSKLSKEVGRLNKEVKKVLPGKLKGLSDKLDSFLGTNQDEVSAQAGQEEQRNAFIQSSVSSIFDKQLQAQASMQAQVEAKTEVSDKLNLVQTKKTHEFLIEIANNTNQNNAFSMQIAKEYYKKSLEIQYRSYYIQADMLETMRNYYKTFSGQFDVIGKNTALPEFVKLKQTERLKEFTRNKLMEEVYNKTLGKSEYIDNLKKNFAGFVNEKVQGITDSLSSVTQGLIKDMAIDYGSDVASDKLSDKLRDKVGKNKYVQAGRGYMSSLVKSPEVFFNTLTGKANKRLNQIDNATDNPMVGTIVNTLSSMMDVFKPKGLDMSVENDSVLTNKNPAIFDNNVYRSITDVIPMYLRKLLKSSMDLTGMYHMTNAGSLERFKATEELHFDYTNRKLDTLGNVKESIKNEFDELTNKSTVTNVVSTVAAAKKMNAKQAKSMRAYVEKASTVLKPEEITAENLFENYAQNEQLMAAVKKDPILEEYLKSLSSGDASDIRGTQAKKYAQAKSTINYRLKQINDKDNVDFVKNLLNALLHHNGDNAELSFTTELCAPIVDSFKKYIIKDGGVLTEDNLVSFKPFGYVPAEFKEQLVPLVNALVKKIFSIVSDGKMADKGMLMASLADLHRAISDSDILNPDLVKTVREYNRDLVDVTKKNGRLTLDLSTVTSLSVRDDETTIATDEFYVDTSVNNEGKDLDDFVKKVKTGFAQGKDKVVSVSEQIKTDVSKVKTFADAKKLVTQYAQVVKTEGTKVFNAAKADVTKSMGEIEAFIKSTEEFKDLEKSVTEIADKVKAQVHDKLELMRTRFSDAIEQKEAEIAAYETLKAAITAKEGASQTDKDKEIKGLDLKITVVNHEIIALKAARDLLNTKVNITGTVKSFMEGLKGSLSTMKDAIDAELAKLESPAP